jgi:hypothetical protein
VSAIARLSNVLAKAFASKSTGYASQEGSEEYGVPPPLPIQGSFRRWDPNINVN